MRINSLKAMLAAARCGRVESLDALRRLGFRRTRRGPLVEAALRGGSREALCWLYRDAMRGAWFPPSWADWTSDLSAHCMVLGRSRDCLAVMNALGFLHEAVFRARVARHVVAHDAADVMGWLEEDCGVDLSTATAVGAHRAAALRGRCLGVIARWVRRGAPVGGFLEEARRLREDQAGAEGGAESRAWDDFVAGLRALA